MFAYSLEEKSLSNVRSTSFLKAYNTLTKMKRITLKQNNFLLNIMRTKDTAKDYDRLKCSFILLFVREYAIRHKLCIQVKARFLEEVQEGSMQGPMRPSTKVSPTAQAA